MKLFESQSLLKNPDPNAPILITSARKAKNPQALAFAPGPGLTGCT